MALTKRLLNAAFRPVIRQQALKQLQQIRAAPVPRSEEIAAAAEEAMANVLSPDEQRWVDSIESLRTTLSQSTTPVSITDYGAGNPTDNRTSEQMLAGVTKTTTVGRACRVSKSYFWSLLLFKLVRKLQPTTAIELGTCLGISAAYQAAALELNGRGRLFTLEGAPALAELSQRHLRGLNLDNATVVTGRFADTLEPTLAAHAPIHYAFIDGHHDEQATIAYYQQIRTRLVDNAVLVFDDIAWSPGMRRAWQKLEADNGIALSLDLQAVGICVVTSEPRQQRHRFIVRPPA